jgi:3-phosphoshikimate 1-carboxyvinyltransferase
MAELLAAAPLRSCTAKALTGDLRVPGDKSISHRSLLLPALAAGRSTVSGLLEAEDTLATAAALRQLGVRIERTDDGEWRIDGVGIGGLQPPTDILDLGNSGTGARLIIGLLASHPFTAVVTGDASLRRRPMRRIIEPLAATGAEFRCAEDQRLPITVTGASRPMPIDYRLPVASAQVKSAILLAGLNAPGRTSVIEPEPTRDHTERMLRLFGAAVSVGPSAGGGNTITLDGQPELRPTNLQVPGDPSSAAFPIAAALIVPDSDITIRSIGINPLRTGLFETLRDMGADLSIDTVDEQSGDPVADIRVRHSRLSGISVPAERAPSMIDEYPVLAVIAACAEGTTVLSGLGELRVKESDRLAAIEAGLKANGVEVEAGPDSLTIHGHGRAPAGGGRVVTHMDHRIAMAFLVLGLATEAPVTVDDGSMIATSFPEFRALMAELGAAIEPTGP